jgi:transcriptional regulator with XRE-family HTH domain
MKLNDFLRLYREGKGLSQLELAEQMQVTVYKLRKWETGEGKPKSIDQEKISKYFNLKSLVEISEDDYRDLVLGEKPATKPSDENTYIKGTKLTEVDTLFKLLEEKDKRISDLQRTVTMMEKVLDLKRNELANLPFLHGSDEG